MIYSSKKDGYQLPEIPKSDLVPESTAKSLAGPERASHMGLTPCYDGVVHDPIVLSGDSDSLLSAGAEIGSPYTSSPNLIESSEADQFLLGSIVALGDSATSH